jgi:imidazolonepropionase-like amidohydrolase
LLGVADRVGTIEVGKDADLALFSHHPFDVTTLVVRTWVDGEQVFDRATEGTPDARP